ncbi:MAG: hypothetical protein OXC25_13155 [Thiotrichales bacterium]|nr:hypothetical protein [Thiotrichales bacterium]
MNERKIDPGTEGKTSPSGTTTKSGVPAHFLDDDENTETKIPDLEPDPDNPDEPPVVSFTNDSGSVAEGGTAPIGVILSRAPEEDIEVTFTVVAAGTATATDDYTISLTVTIPAGRDTAVPVPVTIVDDDAEEQSETLILMLAADPVGNDYTVGTRPTFTLTITDDDGTTVTPPVQPTIPAGTSVGTGTNEQQGDLSRAKVETALGKGVNFSNNAPSDGALTGETRWGVWLDDDDDLYIWANGPDETVSYDYPGVSADGLSGTATYNGDVVGIGYHGTTGFGEFTAVIGLTATFGTGDGAGVKGTVSNFEGEGAGSWGTVTLENGGNVNVAGSVTGGGWSNEFYRTPDNTGQPEGAYGYVDLRFSDGRAAGAYHAVK